MYLSLKNYRLNKMKKFSNHNFRMMKHVTNLSNSSSSCCMSKQQRVEVGRNSLENPNPVACKAHAVDRIQLQLRVGAHLKSMQQAPATTAERSLKASNSFTHMQQLQAKRLKAHATADRRHLKTFRRICESAAT